MTQPVQLSLSEKAQVVQIGDKMSKGLLRWFAHVLRQFLDIPSYEITSRKDVRRNKHAGHIIT